MNSSSKWNIHEKKLSKARYYHAVSAIDENRMIITGGYNGSILDTVEVFDIANGSIIPLPNMPQKRCCHSSVILGTYLYIIGGDGGDNKTVYRMNLSKIDDYLDSSVSLSDSNLWETTDVSISDIDGERRECATVVVHDGWIYLLGGNGVDDNVLSSCLRYRLDLSDSSLLDHTNIEWERIESMDTARESYTAITVGDSIYVMGGNDNDGEYLDTIEIFDPSTNIFEYGPPLPIPLCDMTAVVVREYIVVNGGYTTNEEMNEKTFLFDINQQTWSTINLPPSLNTPRYNHAATVLQSYKIVVCGGEDSKWNSLFDTIEWISLEEILYGKRWNRRKVYILLRCLLEKGRASLPMTTTAKGSTDSKRKRENETTLDENSYFQCLIQEVNDDIFRSVMQFL